MRVRVEDFRARRAQPLGFGDERGERACVQRVIHVAQNIQSPARGSARTGGRAPTRAYPDREMAILEQIKGDMQGALRAGEKERVGALRLLVSELQKAAKEGSADELAILRRERKRRLEAARAYGEAGREDLAAPERAEAELIGSYLPAELSEEEVKAIVERSVRESGAESIKDMGRVMKHAMAAIDGRADGKVVSGLVRASLEG
jgi:uncharacterized protein YqeY